MLGRLYNALLICILSMMFIEGCIKNSMQRWTECFKALLLFFVIFSLHIYKIVL